MLTVHGRLKQKSTVRTLWFFCTLIAWILNTIIFVPTMLSPSTILVSQIYLIW